MKHICKCYMLLAVLTAGTLSCNKIKTDSDIQNDISFEVSTGTSENGTGAATKAQRYNSETDFASQTFGLYAWNASKSDAVVYTNEPVSKTGGKWKPASSAKWSTKHTYVFEAIYPKPAASLGTVGLTALTVSSTPGDLTFSYKIPTSTGASEDKDFMLACYSGTSSNGVAPLTFTHPLTCVNFKAGTLTNVSKINSIEISGVYESGSCTVIASTYGTPGRMCYAYEKSDETHTSLWTPAGSTSVTGTSQITASALDTSMDAYNFLLIPQNTAVRNAVIKVNLTTADDKTYDVSATVSADYWRAGYTNTYKIAYEAGGVLKVTLSATEFNGENWISHDSGNTGANPFEGQTW